MPSKQSNSTPLNKWGYIILLIVLFAAAILTLLYRKSARPVLQRLHDKNITYKTYEGTIGTRTKIMLPDNTPVILNSHSRLLVPSNFAQQRIVLLDGEAYFDSTAHPITVKTNIVTMSTQAPSIFKLRCFEAQQGATAYVLQGQVKVVKSYHSATDNQPEILGPGNMILANKEIDLMEKETYHPVDMEVWRQEKLMFHDEPFMNAVHKLEDWYSTEIYVEGDVSGAGNVDGDFQGKTLQEVMDEMKKTAKFVYKVKKDKIVVEF
ncbi:FecR family protein [Chitinophaga tropicalis]|uniref:DUF4974 domain-containing protein n=1 Tax=Chitinophaga tropicalis TaxID=2683588 RepID=A0A7K1UB68_9BACT|nr:FecR family protein [Chitinophaga tropicalis]MVT11627.1 DUF4974 domain-containing protein [Chitinophaga tropicalis]